VHISDKFNEIRSFYMS